jgi:predicted alpha/beta-fold hydrolase
MRSDDAARDLLVPSTPASTHSGDSRLEAMTFRPSAWTVGAHRQTILGYWLRRRLRFTPPVENLIVDAGHGARLLCYASWQPGPRAAHPALVLVHGLGGHANAGYMFSMGRLAYERGYHVVRMNLRGAGESEELCPRLYNAGLSSDVSAVLNLVARTVPRVALTGFSLGGNLALLAASRDAALMPAQLFAVAAICTPFDLAACARCIDGPGNGFYLYQFMSNLRAAYGRRQRLLSEAYEVGLERRLRTIHEYDDVITARYGGFRDVHDYYARSSSGPYLHALARPTLLLSAADDPLIPPASLAHWPLAPGVVRELWPTGGHVGFVAKSDAPGSFWAADRVLAFFDDVGPVVQ